MVSLITALEIQGNGDDVKCEAHGPFDNGKYEGWMYLWRNDHIHKPMLNTQSVFDTEKEAVKYMENLITEIREMDL